MKKEVDMKINQKVILFFISSLLLLPAASFAGMDDGMTLWIVAGNEPYKIVTLVGARCNAKLYETISAGGQIMCPIDPGSLKDFRIKVVFKGGSHMRSCTIITSEQAPYARMSGFSRCRFSKDDSAREKYGTWYLDVPPPYKNGD